MAVCAVMSTGHQLHYQCSILSSAFCFSCPSSQLIVYYEDGLESGSVFPTDSRWEIAQLDGNAWPPSLRKAGRCLCSPLPKSPTRDICFFKQIPLIRRQNREIEIWPVQCRPEMKWVLSTRWSGCAKATETFELRIVYKDVSTRWGDRLDLGYQKWRS